MFWKGIPKGSASSIWVFPRIGGNPNHPLKNKVFPYFHHPFWGFSLYFRKHQFKNVLKNPSSENGEYFYIQPIFVYIVTRFFKKYFVVPKQLSAIIITSFFQGASKISKGGVLQTLPSRSLTARLPLKKLPYLDPIGSRIVFQPPPFFRGF